MLITRIRNLDGPFSKSLSMVDGKLVKTAAADLVNGMAHRVRADDIDHLANIIGGLTAQEALTFGVPAFEQGKITTKENVARGKALRGAVPRDRAHFTWPEGETGLMLDIDQPRDGSEPFTAKAFDNLLERILPWWANVSRFYRPSVSAFVYGPDGQPLSGRGSLRCYSILDKGENAPFVGVAIVDALWRAGYGRIEFGSGLAKPSCVAPLTRASGSLRGSILRALRFSLPASPRKSSRPTSSTAASSTARQRLLPDPAR